MVAQWCVVNRAGETEEIHVLELLLATNEEVLICVALCADAGDEGMVMIRDVDTEKHDASRVAKSCPHALATWTTCSSRRTLPSMATLPMSSTS